ncbi:MAG: DNA translocase FtsK, partial [Candidatus Ventricola sp.]
MSFSGVGMYLSELLDDLRAARSEQREERAALRESREEEALRRETERAEQREARRLERERQAAEERERLDNEAKAGLHDEEITDVQPAAEKPVRKRKARPAPEAVKPQEPAQDMPPLQAESAGRQPAQRTAPQTHRRAAIREDMPLYIERDEEFTRESIETRTEPHGPRRRHSFTMQEAENAFLYGMNSAGPAPAQEPAYGEPAEPGWEAEPASATAYTQEAPSYGQETPVYAAYSPADQPDEAAQRELPADDGEEDEPQEAVPFWKANPDMVIEHDAAQDDGAIVRDAMEQDEPVTPLPMHRAAMNEPPANVIGAGEGALSTPLSRSIAAAQAAANRDVPKVQNVLAAQEAAAKDDTIVQLRGTRLDGTPLVMPKKDAHEAPKVEGPAYVYPPIDLLNRTNSTQDPNINAKIQQGAAKLLSTLESFGVQAKLTHVTHGPAITRYELQPAPGVKVSRIVNLVDDIALNMAADGVRIEAPIPGKPAVGIEIPNEKIETVSLRDVLESPEMMREKSPTAVALGKGISGAPVVADMAKMPHVLIAGATGSGKSVCINTIINSIIYRASPREVRLILIDPKVVELSVYNG